MEKYIFAGEKALSMLIVTAVLFWWPSPTPQLPVLVNKWKLGACCLIVTCSLNSYVKMRLRPSHGSQALSWAVLFVCDLGSGLDRVHLAQGQAKLENQHLFVPPIPLTSELCSFKSKHFKI